jgi:hypothetical protein
MSAPDSMKGERIGRATLLLILFTAAALRLSAVGFGNHSLTFQPDEDSNVPLALTLSWADLNPHAFYYPAFLWYMLFAMDRLVFWFGKQYGLLRHWQDLQRLFAEHPLPFFFLSRTLSVAFGTATVGLVYLLGRRLFSPAHGLLAAGFLAVTFLHVRDSALATPDAPTTFFVVLSLLGTAAVLAQGRVRDYVLAAGAAGLATATKYNAVRVRPSRAEDGLDPAGRHEILGGDDLPTVIVDRGLGVRHEEQPGRAPHRSGDALRVIAVDPVQRHAELAKQPGDHRDGSDERRRDERDALVSPRVPACIPAGLLSSRPDQRQHGSQPSEAFGPAGRFRQVLDERADLDGQGIESHRQEHAGEHDRFREVRVQLRRQRLCSCPPTSSTSPSPKAA